MNIKDCIDLVDNEKPNQYTIKEKVMWLSFIEAIIINEVLKTHEGYDGRYDMFEGYSEDKLTVKLIVPAPYDRLYTQYLKMKIDEANGEITRYNNSAALYNAYMSEYRKYYNKTHMPIDVTKKTKDIINKLPMGNGLTDAEMENVIRELTYILTEQFAGAVSEDKIYDIVMRYMQNNTELFRGEPGKEGYSPKVTVEETENGHTVSIKDKYGLHTFDVENGKDGKDGEGGNYETEIADIEITTNGFKATFKTPLENGMQLYYDYAAGSKPANGMAKPIKINGDGKLEVSIGDKHHTDFALKGIADVGSNTMTFSFIENVDYPVYVKELSIPTPIPFKFLGISTGVNLGFNSEIKENSLNSNNFGSSNSIEGEHNNTFGTGNTIQAKNSTIFGQDSTITANLCYLFGDNNASAGRCNFGVGSFIDMLAENSGAIGYGLIVTGDNQLVTGRFNRADKDAALIIGDGADDANRKNVFVVKNDGKIYVNEKPFTLLSETDKTKLNSFNSTGVDNSNSGSSSAQFGFRNNNSYDNVMQIGRENVSGGQYVYQIGYGNKSLSGQEYLFGKKLLSSEWEQVVVGKFNENVNNAIFVVGNGTSESDRKNAMVIDKYNDVKFSGRVKASAITLVSPNGTEFDVAINDDGTFRIT